MAQSDCNAFKGCGGSTAPPGTGNFDCCPKKFTLTAVDYTAQVGEDVILVDATANTVTVTLPVFAKDTILFISDFRGKATTNSISITPFGAGTTINFANLDKLFEVNFDIATCLYHSATKNWHVELMKAPAANKATKMVVNNVTAGSTFNAPLADEQLIVVDTGISPTIGTSATIAFTYAYSLSPIPQNGQKITIKDGTGNASVNPIKLTVNPPIIVIPQRIDAVTEPGIIGSIPEYRIDVDYASITFIYQTATKSWYRT